MNLFKKILIVFFVLIILLEITLRLFGIGNPVLYVEDVDYEYMYAPNQKIKRFGNNIITNEFGMRSKPINKNDTIVVLVIGDSVLNGGTMLDQDSLSTSLLEKSLTNKFNQTIRVLNISAGSWGPDNAMAFIKKHGTFNSFLLVFVFSSHDLYDKMMFNKIVGVQESYPNNKPILAIAEVMNRYVLNSEFFKEKKVYKKNSKIYDVSAYKTIAINNGWEQMHLLNKKIDILGYIHPMKAELQQNKYNVLGNMLIEHLKKDSIEFILGINYMKKEGYRDDIHTNNTGHKIIANALEPIICNKLKIKLHKTEVKCN